MDVSVLHSVTEDLAGYLSELTTGDLDRPTSGAAGNVGALYRRLMEQNLQVASVLTVDASPWVVPSGAERRAAVHAPANAYGGGYENEYRRTASLMEAAFSSRADSALVPLHQRDYERTVAELYAAVVGEVVHHASELARALGLGYQPRSMVAAYLGDAEE
ncbi:hypothetical protein ACFFGH_25805 [Lysobacter korlensis]|uniref:DinB-like domain-containing protein n=1 Tax=Lysobacter korlensis TaxID=553636 RepID=A0ABV6RWB2_9GAMM